MLMILLDTHALIWWADIDPQLSSDAQQAIAKEQKTGLIGVSSFSCWEIALLVSRGKVDYRSDSDVAECSYRDQRRADKGLSARANDLVKRLTSAARTGRRAPARAGRRGGCGCV
jgi:PIN domain nuclease of toxin-antitoxin system